MLKITKISDIYKNKEELSKLEKIKVSGWVKSFSHNKKFIKINDGSTLNNLQIVITQENFSQMDLLEKINFASSLLVSGKLVLTPKLPQPFELKEVKIESVNSTDENYPFQKQNIPLKVVRDYPELRAKTYY